jgi:hypothetical protein
MAYVIAGVLVVLLIGGLVMFLVLNATRKGGSATDSDASAPGIGSDETPLGDTAEHADERGDGDATTAAGTSPADTEGSAHIARPGEGEGAERLEFDDEQPRPGSDTLADRRA